MQNGQPAQYAEKGQPLNLGWEMTAFVFVHFWTFGLLAKTRKDIGVVCQTVLVAQVFDEKDAQIWMMTG